MMVGRIVSTEPPPNGGQPPEDRGAGYLGGCTELSGTSSIGSHIRRASESWAQVGDSSCMSAVSGANHGSKTKLFHI